MPNEDKEQDKKQVTPPMPEGFRPLVRVDDPNSGYIAFVPPEELKDFKMPDWASKEQGKKDDTDPQGHRTRREKPHPLKTEIY